MNNNAKTITLNDHDRLAIVGVVNFEYEGEAKSRWTTIGTALQNKDGSFNLRFEYMPATGAWPWVLPHRVLAGYANPATTRHRDWRPIEKD